MRGPLRMNRALIVVDLQRDFCEGGALAATDTLSLLPPLLGFVTEARNAGVKIVFTQDWHPPDHNSFETRGGSWPIHCVAGSDGAQLMPPLAPAVTDLLVHKGETAVGAGYSGFEGTGLQEKLAALGVREVAICGVATEYCVRATAIDAARAAFRASVLTDLIRAVQVADGEIALRELAELGIQGMKSLDWL